MELLFETRKHEISITRNTIFYFNLFIFVTTERHYDFRSLRCYLNKINIPTIETLIERITFKKSIREKHNLFKEKTRDIISRRDIYILYKDDLGRVHNGSQQSHKSAAEFHILICNPVRFAFSLVHAFLCLSNESII